jgi:calcineurin-like phosphoesterase family protein
MTNRVFVSSDTHFGHVNIIRYCSRPFANISDMNEALIQRWNSRVTTEDIVFFLGDFAMGPGVNEQFILNVLSRLNGEIHVIMGNHDQPSKYGPGLKHIVESNQHRVPHVRIVDNLFKIFHDGRDFVACHFPMQDWENRKHGAVHLHGHTHTEYPTDCKNLLDLENSFDRDKVYDVGVDMYGGPVQLTGDCRYLKSPKGWA